MSRDMDLFEWAATRPTATIIDAREKFLAREVAFLRRLVIGYRPPTSGGATPVDFSAYRSNMTPGPTDGSPAGRDRRSA